MGITILEKIADKHLLKESMIKKQAEIEVVMVRGMEGQVGEGVEQSLESEEKNVL